MSNCRNLEDVEKEYGEYIANIHDLIGDDEPSKLFYFLINNFGYLLNPKDERDLSDSKIKIRRKLHKLIILLGPKFLNNKQVIENRNELLGITNEKEEKIVIPSEPVIFAANHSFKDDVLATVLAAKRHGYILFGSVPQFYNTFDGITAYINGVIMGNRKNSESKNSTVTKSIKLIEKGTNLIIFPEGVWNKTPNQLMIDLWPGIYRISKNTGAKIVPISHYLSDYDQLIHTVVDNAIKIDDLDEKEALRYIRDTISSWHYLMMEKYGKTTRNKILNGKSFDEKWEEELLKRIKTADRYDTEIELCADYRPKYVVREEDVYSKIASINNYSFENAKIILNAKDRVNIKKLEDFQRRF